MQSISCRVDEFTSDKTFLGIKLILNVFLNFLNFLPNLYNRDEGEEMGN